MSFLLGLIEDLDRELYNSSLYDHDFGYGVHPHHIQPQPQHHHLHHQREPTIAQLLGLRNMTGQHPLRPTSAAVARRAADEKARNEGHQLSAIGKDGFQVCMDVAQFKPSELTVKVTGDNCVVVEGKHEERQDDHGYISRHFVRRYTLPKDYDPEKVMSTLSSDGILTISVPKPQPIESSSGGRVIQIQQTGPAHLNIKANPQSDEANGEEEPAQA